MDIYKIINWYRRINSPKMKLLGILMLHVLKRRYLYIAIDPSLACNLRCRMCHFSNPNHEKELHGAFTNEDIQAIAKAVFHRGLKLQIGDGAEPTTFKGLPSIVKEARKHGIPYISISTNGNLMTLELLRQLADDGLHELIVSTHGFEKETYEHMMRNARFERFTQLIKDFSIVQKEHPDLKLRINYTICADNIENLRLLPTFFSSVKPNIIQLRPVQDIGSTAYNNYSMDVLSQKYDEYIRPVIDFCQTNNITCLYPNIENIQTIAQENEESSHNNPSIDMLPFFYLSPQESWKEAFNPYEETFEDFCKRTHRVKFIMTSLMGGTLNESDPDHKMTRALNYNIR